MIETRVVMKTRYRLSESDKEFIKNFIFSHFKARDIQDYYTEEKTAS
ncbi:hypothetical protein LCGC14_1530280 [marine sediment metagenome]|uniref:Uncharacterized protein n=1 Tax=marine sediment metagenome TaxID=412755 RepID=A0A0F9JGV4_9ZZZZ